MGILDDFKQFVFLAFQFIPNILSKSKLDVRSAVNNARQYLKIVLVLKTKNLEQEMFNTNREEIENMGYENSEILDILLPQSWR